MSRIVFEYNKKYSSWDESIRHDERYCVRAFRADDDNIIDAYTVDRKLLGFWNCTTNYGEIYSHV